MSTPHQFGIFKSFVDPTFFAKLSEYKLNEAKLDESSVAIRGFLSAPMTPDKPAAFLFSSKSFEPIKRSRGREYAIPGSVYNFNTIEAFKELDKLQFIRSRASILEQLIKSKEIFEQPARLLEFAVISFCDLKKYKYYYWFCFPSLPFNATITDATRLDEPDLDRAVHEHQQAADDSGIFFSLRRVNDSWHVKHLRSLDFGAKRATVGIVDFGSTEALPWHLRNLCAALAPYFHHALVYVYRDRLEGQWLEIDLSTHNESQVMGWERNAQNKLMPKLTDLGSLQDPLQLSNQAVDLNLKLMKWRAAPEIELDDIKNAKCLLLGAGTLGCYMARGLLAWGVRHISLVDSGNVSYSNPVRQPLFTVDDATQQRPKAEAAAAALRAISPGVTATGHKLEISMAGHPVTNEQQQKADFEKLCRLIDEHDAVFLLMDSRESRWLPSVVCAARRKLVMNVAVGFDSFLAMRHGVLGQDQRLGCYFCNDVVAPIDSISRLSLDQMCTVTRPGVAMLASATAVELVATVYQHPKRELAPHDGSTILGSTAHQLRGFLRDRRTMDIWGPAFDKCPACSEQIITAFNEDGWEFVKSALNKTNFLTELSGLGDLQRATEGLANDLTFSTDEDDEELV